MSTTSRSRTLSRSAALIVGANSGSVMSTRAAP
jgi:hypothetical protein